MDDVLRIELLLNMINTLFGKAVFFKDTKIIDELTDIRHEIYYDTFHYDISLEKLSKVAIKLKKYE